MNKQEFRIFTITALQKDPSLEAENPKWDSLDKLEIISAVHDEFGEVVSTVSDLDYFEDFETLYELLKKHKIVS